MELRKPTRLLAIVTTTSFLFLLFERSSASLDVSPWKLSNIESTRIKTILTTSYGIFAGEYDIRITNPPPYNGVFISRDAGAAWEPSGLTGKGVTGLTYLQNEIYASVYYTSTGNPAGVYKSADKGKTWIHTDISYAGLTIASTESALLFGTASRGLFRSLDFGNTWVQVIGSGYGPDIRALYAYKTKALVSTRDNKVYSSDDNGATWSQILELDSKIINNLYINDKIMLAGTSNNEGIFKSTNEGQSWEKIESFGNYSSGPFVEIKGVIYTGRYSESAARFGIFKTSDLGKTWFDISDGLGATDSNAVALASIYTNPNKFLASFTANSVKEYSIPTPQSPITPFLDLPWQYDEFNKDAQRIYSFFDHKYPLLAYPYYSEPASSASTTVNFKGLEKKEPQMYYSSHNGIDYTLPFGTEILAPDDGYATYSYTSGGGHTIKLDHGNGFQTQYLHLQKTDLITTKTSTPIFVNKSDVLGKVGLSGNTTGPHLHLTVLRDVNDDGVYNDYPDGLVDPYGWEGKTDDPWEKFAWEDSLGSHNGSQSNYLFVKSLKRESSLYLGYLVTIIHDLISILIPEGLTEYILTFESTSYPVGRGGPDNLFAVEGGGLELKSYDLTGLEHGNFEQNIMLKVDYQFLNTLDLFEESMSFYKLSESGEWEKIISAVNSEEHSITAQTNQTGVYAVFGSAKDIISPVTEIQISGVSENQVFTSDVFVTLTARDEDLGSGIDSIYFKIIDSKHPDTDDWQIYQEPILLRKNGNFEIYVKALDKAGNSESEKVWQIIILKPGWFKQLTVLKSTFNIGGW